MKQTELMPLVSVQGKATAKGKKRKLSLKIKLISAFLLFTAVMLVVLWVFQTVFLDDFYKFIKKNQMEKTADYICRHIEDEDIEEYLKSLKERSSMVAGVYDTSEDFFRRVYSSTYHTEFGIDIMPHEIYTCYEKAKQSGDKVIFESGGSVAESAFPGIWPSPSRIERPEFDNEANTHLTCAVIMNLKSGEEYMLILRTPITPVTSTVETLKIQLIIVSLLLGVTGVVFAVVVSLRISRPLAKTNKGAKELARQNYNVSFEQDGYKEIRELNETLSFAASELSKVDSLRRELISNISHDLRTPLTMIGGYAEVMRDIPGENTPENVQVIIDETQRLSQLVSDLLDLSRLESGNAPVCMEAFSITDSIRGMFTRYSKLVAKDNYNLQFDFDCNVTVVGDEVRLSQVVYNLINNAINYSGEDKTVVVSQTVSEDKVRIEVTDHGEGIAAEDLRNIWDRYYRVDKEHRSAVIGTGLGLSIAKNVLLLHNARFGVRSTKGNGSTFWFELKAVDIRSSEKNEE